jgi:chromosomal replication initiator protein
MNIHNTELIRQHRHYAEIRDRLTGKPSKPEPAAKVASDDDQIAAGMRTMISKLTKEVRFLRECLRHSASADQRVKDLELSLADAHASILAQAEMLKVQEQSDVDLDDDNQPLMRRPVRVIAEEVLQDYPGITWEDVKGIRRVRKLIKPRKACIRAVFEERKDLSSVKIGKIFGGRDHSTILHSIRTAP